MRIMMTPSPLRIGGGMLETWPSMPAPLLHHHHHSHGRTNAQPQAGEYSCEGGGVKPFYFVPPTEPGGEHRMLAAMVRGRSVDAGSCGGSAPSSSDELQEEDSAADDDTDVTSFSDNIAASSSAKNSNSNRSRTRRKLERYRTMPITFEEIREVEDEDADSQHVPPAANTSAAGNSGSASRGGDSGSGRTSNDDRSPHSVHSERRLSTGGTWQSPRRCAPGGVGVSGGGTTGALKTSLRLSAPIGGSAGGRGVHWRSTESLLKEKLLSHLLLPVIPEQATSPGSPAASTAAIVEEVDSEDDDYVPASLSRTHTQ